MEDFESIKENTAKSLRENEINTSQMKDWKLGMRKTLLDVRQQFVDWIDNFTNKFIKSLSKKSRRRAGLVICDLIHVF